MKRLVGLTSAVALLLLLPQATASAQSIFLGGGASIPVGQYSDDGAKTGWVGVAGFTFDVGDQGLWVGAEGLYGRNTHETAGEATNLIGGNALLGYSFGEEGTTRPYVYGSAGFLNHQFDEEGQPKDNDTKFSWGGAVGVGHPVGGQVGIWGEVRYLSRGSSTRVVAIVAGVDIGFSGN